MAENFEQFMKANKKEKPDIEYAATTSLCDAKGNPLKWKLRYIKSEELENLRSECTKEIPATGRYGRTVEKLDDKKFISALMCASIVYPDLRNTALQESYGVKNQYDLLYAMIDNAGEYSALQMKINEMNNFDETMEDKVNEAKNL